MQIYFIDNDDYFKRKYTIAGDDNVEFGDNDERSIFYIRGVLETIKKLRWIPDVIDCHGWMTALTGLYIKTVYADDPCFKNTKIVYSLYNDDFKQPFNPNFIDKLKFDGIKDKGITELKNAVDYETLSNIAVKYADGVIQSEESINKNILDQVNKTGKKFLSYQGGVDASVDAINDFYENL
jgi:starch synthase